MEKPVEASADADDGEDGNAPDTAMDTATDAATDTATDTAVEMEVIRTSDKRVACDGGVHGHPQVWLNLGDDDRIVCPYCSRVFVLAGSRHDGPENNGIA